MEDENKKNNVENNIEIELNNEIINDIKDDKNSGFPAEIIDKDNQRDEKGRFVKGNTIGPRFDKDNQPDPLKVGAGIKRSWEYKHIRKSMMEELTEIKLPDGTIRNFWTEAAKMLQAEILGSKSKLAAEKKLKALMKLLDLTPRDDNLNFATEDSNLKKITLEFVNKSTIDNSNDISNDIIENKIDDDVFSEFVR